MQIGIRRPVVQRISSFMSQGEQNHVIVLADKGRGVLDVFIEGDWASWDRLVEAVAEYRERTNGS